MKIPVLDHGFVLLRNVAGPTRRPTEYRFESDCLAERPFDADDVDPAQSARMSFGNTEVRTREADLKLARYLLKNRHTTPFEMVQVWIEMKLPIFVARQFVRHRTVAINEISGRYVTLPAEWYIPEAKNVGKKITNVKQGRGEIGDDKAALTKAEIFSDNLDWLCRCSYEVYLKALAFDIPPEEARLCLHLNHYTHWLWTQNLWNVLHFLSLRLDSHAQWEAQQYARAIAQALESALPETMALFYSEFGLSPGSGSGTPVSG